MKCRPVKSESEKKIENSLEYLNSPCSIKEAVQLARGVAEDVVNDYSTRMNHVLTAISIQVELLKEVLVSKGIITEEEFKTMYIEQVEKVTKMQQEAVDRSNIVLNESAAPVEDSPKMEAKVNDIEIKKV